MFDEIDGMVLDQYNAVSMDLDAEAALFRQVPFACVLTETDTLKTVCTVWVAATSDEVHSTQGLLGAQGDSQRLGKRGQ